MAVGSTFDVERRRRGLTEQLRETGAVRIEEAATEWVVHPMTIRRDLRSLQQDGVARLVRGGAVFAGPTGIERRQALARPAKRRIAEKAQQLVPRGAAVGIDASTTALELVGQVMPDDLIVVTYGLEAFGLLQERPGARVYLTGGERDRRTGSLVGPLALRALHGFSLARCFLSATGVHPALGCTEPTAEEVEVKQAMAAVSAHVVLLADSTKLHLRSSVRSLELAQVDLLITELDPDDARLAPFREVVELR
ncbi:DeoR/GlpR family DNA-binding transcription regulator [Modestobacter sp. KNN46-3]|jgi:DeoR/GlpR family transcriptional regulator of sugar metabolism|uniref:DeoR/GlpR family DNA-binding transcription regulator n=1 Tax=Modestobacter sp. KNN46-3 TaxID=2711218 RepID=UPI0013DEA33F|nr:DeoR/GlpR family DNA-binding transcription regulator [Modestobacter sp. KNN46-3]